MAVPVVPTETVVCLGYLGLNSKRNCLRSLYALDGDGGEDGDAADAVAVAAVGDDSAVVAVVFAMLMMIAVVAVFYDYCWEIRCVSACDWGCCRLFATCAVVVVVGGAAVNTRM